MSNQINNTKTTFGLNNVQTYVFVPGNSNLPNSPTQPFTVEPINGNSNTSAITPIAVSKTGNADMFYLGGNVFSNLDIAGFNIKFPLVLFNVSQTRNIVTTKIQGRDGSIKEYISDGDYDITIKGTIPGVNGVFPMQAVNQLISICEAKLALHINSFYLNTIFGIYDIVISSYAMDQEAGKTSEFPFTITAISDSPIQLKLKS